MAKKGEKRDMSAVRAARGSKGKRDLSQDRWKLQATITLPVDSDVQPNDLKKLITDGGGTISIKSRNVVRGYKTEDESSSSSDADDTTPNAIDAPNDGFGRIAQNKRPQAAAT